jgi:ABC-type lipoprotein release transport system permease subunit
LFDKIVGLNGHAVVQGYGGQLPDWRNVLAEAKRTPGVTSATPLIEQPLMASFGRAASRAGWSAACAARHHAAIRRSPVRSCAAACAT